MAIKFKTSDSSNTKLPPVSHGQLFVSATSGLPALKLHSGVVLPSAQEGVVTLLAMGNEPNPAPSKVHVHSRNGSAPELFIGSAQLTYNGAPAGAPRYRWKNDEVGSTWGPGETVSVELGNLYLINISESDFPSTLTFELPAITSSMAGQIWGWRDMTSYTDEGGPILLVPNASDSIDGAAAGLTIQADEVKHCFFEADGVNRWNLISLGLGGAYLGDF